MSLGLLYLFPIMLAAGFLPRWAIMLLCAGCAVLREAFGMADQMIDPRRVTGPLRWNGAMV
jgi:hypothetical protein